MATTILVTGGTGTLGRQVVERLAAAGHAVRVASRHATTADPAHDAARPAAVENVAADLDTGRGVDAALAGIRTVVHCAGAQKGDGDKARMLVRAARDAGVIHLVFISVVGADRVPVTGRFDHMAFEYFASKRDAEGVVEGCGIPWTTLRATQFHDLALLTLKAMAKLPVVPVPSGTRFQPVDSGEVADRLVEIALGSPAGYVPDLGGPTAYAFGDLLRSYLAAAGLRRLIVPVRLPGDAARAIRAGANLALDHADGRRTWEEFLAGHLPVRA
ncbi:SDR family oxidoreductase [Sinomonas sp. P10A9]|uniref:SDR family oxidoreductase n=1 Tax=Sinomonas puerhi TaxID=3238584 RepID=A0AB39L5B1_9MICC